MPQQEAHVVGQMWEEIAAAVPDLDAWRAVIERWWHPDLVYEEDPRWPGSGRYRGRERVRQVFESYADVLGNASFTLEEVRPAADAVVALVRVRGSSPAGVPWDHIWAYLTRLRDRKVSYMRAYWEIGEALEDAGISR